MQRGLREGEGGEGAGDLTLLLKKGKEAELCKSPSLVRQPGGQNLGTVVWGGERVPRHVFRR